MSLKVDGRREDNHELLNFAGNKFFIDRVIVETYHEKLRFVNTLIAVGVEHVEGNLEPRLRL